jgi:hypothetical protein
MQTVSQDFGPPEYDDADLIDEINEVDDTVTTIVIDETRDVDAGAAYGYDAGVYWGYQRIQGSFIATPGEEFTLEIVMTTAVPLELVADVDGSVVYNYVTFENQDVSAADDAKVVCRTTVADEYGFSVSQMSPATDFSEEMLLENEELTVAPEDAVFRSSD